MDVAVKTLMPGVKLTAVRTDKFKSSFLSLSLLTPLERSTVTANALIPSVLRRGTQEYPDTRALSAALDDLCGGTLEARVQKQGNIQSIGFWGSFLDDAFSPDGMPILERAAALMGGLLLRPALENGVFRAAYVAGEGRNQADRIRAQINEKRQYSIKRLCELMCSGEPYGLDKLGFAQEAAAITAEQLWQRYQALLRSAPLNLYYCGSAPAERVEAALRAALEGLPARTASDLPPVRGEEGLAEDVRYFTDSMDVTQGKLVMGWRTGGITMGSAEYPALLVLNALYGGTTTSKLFMNVRERLSLCYFASSMLDKQKGLMLVSSGIEFDQYERARDEILAQLRACADGDFSAQELEAARRAVVSSLTACVDSQGRMEDYWTVQSAAGLCQSPDELAAAVEKVDRGQVIDAAKRLRLDAVYFLKGKEA